MVSHVVVNRIVTMGAVAMLGLSCLYFTTSFATSAVNCYHY